MTETVVSISLGSFDWGPLALAAKTIVGLVAANFFLGVGAAVKGRRFDPSKLPGFIVDDLLPGFIALVVIAVGIVTEDTPITAVGGLAVAAVAYSTGPSIKRSFLELFGGLVPRVVRDALDRIFPDPPAA